MYDKIGLMYDNIVYMYDMIELIDIIGSVK